MPKRQLVLKEGLRGITGSNGPGSPVSGDGESCPNGGRCSERASGGKQFPTARAHQPEGTGSCAQAAVGAQGGLAGDGSCQRRGLTGMRGRGVLPSRRLVLKEGLWQMVAPNGPGSPVKGTGSRVQAVGGAQGGVAGDNGSQLRAYQPERTGSPAQAAVGAKGGPGADGSSQRPRITSITGRGVPPKRWSMFMEGLRGIALPNSPGFRA